jgi:hypothetical protein
MNITFNHYEFCKTVQVHKEDIENGILTPQESFEILANHIRMALYEHDLNEKGLKNGFAI